MPDPAAVVIFARRRMHALIFVLALGALAGAFIILQAYSGPPPQPPVAPGTDLPERRIETTENGSSPPYELSAAEVPEKGPGERLFGSCQAFESDSELWIFLDVDVRIPRSSLASPPYGEHQLALHTLVLDQNGVKGHYATQPTLTANSNITCFIPHNGSFYAWQGPNASQPALLYRWTEAGFQELPANDRASLMQQLGIAGLQHLQMEDRLLEIAERSGFRRIADGRPPPHIVSERLELQVLIGRENSPNQVVAESLDSGKTWREVLLEIDPHWSGTAR